jgi:hypothetical protein
MNHTTRPFILLLISGLLSWSVATPAFPATGELSYVFSQDGYAAGATVSGSFSGVDLDGNGILVHFPSRGGGTPPPIQIRELTSWSMHFSGNSLAQPFDLSLSELFGFVYEIGTRGIGDDPAFDPTINENLIEGVGAFSAAHFYTSGLGPNSFIGGYVGGEIDFEDFNNLEDHALDSTQSLLLVTLVPEPGAISLLIPAALLLARARRRSR